MSLTLFLEGLGGFSFTIKVVKKDNGLRDENKYKIYV
jgi:hypothetical protein